ncbi:MAG: hypothetical protein RMJ66_05430, partial [Bacteroidia bacterium]|nr:hypothetical protein [Bacteroidia bacterium]
MRYLFSLITGVYGWAVAQGLPLWRSFTEDEYGAYTYVRAIVQDRETGLLYIGTNQGVSEYDGQRWRFYPTPSLIRALAISPNHRIWVGAIGDLGELRTDSVGQLRYVSYRGFLPKDKQQFGDVEAIFTDSENRVFFIAQKGVVYIDGAQLAVAPKVWSVGEGVRIAGSGQVGNEIWVNLQGGGGLHRVSPNGFEPVPGGKLFDEKYLSGIVEIDRN